MGKAEHVAPLNETRPRRAWHTSACLPKPERLAQAHKMMQYR